MKVAAVQADIVWEDKPANHRIIESMLDEAAIEPGTFVLLPELADTGFSLDVEKIVDDRSLQWATEFARRRRIWLQMGHPALGPEGKGRNCATIINPAGKAIGTYEKVHPFSYGKEIHRYSGGDHILLRRLHEADGRPVACPLICYDLRFPELWRLAAVGGAELFTIGASWPNPRQAHWRALLIARAIENQAWVVAVNRTGDDPHLSYDGGSMIVSPQGEIINEADKKPAVLQATLDLEALRAWRGHFGALRDAHPSLLGTIAVDSDTGA